MGPSILRHTAASAGAELDRLWFLDNAEDDWRSAAVRVLARCVVVDSVSRLGVGDPVTWCQQAIGWCESRGIALLLLAHENKRGRSAGSTGLEHDPAAVFRIEDARGDGTARLAIKKRRLGPLGSCRVELVPGALDRLKCRGKRLAGASADDQPNHE
jgi:hypothetical protein